MDKSEITKLQQRLVNAGFSLQVDGHYGPATAEAYRRYLNGLGPTDPEPAADTLPVPPAPKPWWNSTAYRSSLAQLLISLAALAGLSLDPTQVSGVLTSIASIVGLTTGQEATTVAQWAVALSSLVAAAAGLWGTAKRSAPIDGNLILPGVRIRSVTAPPTEFDGGQ